MKRFEPEKTWQTYTLVTDESFKITDYIPAPFDGKNNDFDEQILALFSNDCCVCDYEALGFVGGTGLTAHASGATANVLHIRPVDVFGKLPFEELMYNYFGEDWDDISALVKSYTPHGGGEARNFAVHNSNNEYYIYIMFSHHVDGRELLTMIFTADTKKEN